jgi:transcriptional regulator with XRE-family HTH domain
MDTMTDLAELGQLLKETREQSGMSQRQAAEAANISPTYVRALESSSNPNTNKPSRPSPAVLMAISSALNIEPDVLLRLAGYDPDPAKRATSQSIAGPAQRGLERDLKRIRYAAKELSQRTPFIQAQSVERFSKFTSEFVAMADGTFRCTPEEEPYLTRVAYRQAKATIRAVSYQDESWWESKGGRDYLKLHDEVRDKRVDITRIFLVPEDRRYSLRETFQAHVDLKIPTFVMSPSDVPVELCRDFVIFDEELLRVSGPPRLDDRKAAEFTDSAARILQALGDFHALYRIAVNMPTEAEHILSQMA